MIEEKRKNNAKAPLLEGLQYYCNSWPQHTNAPCGRCYPCRAIALLETKDTYQGWENYETWAVALWIDNDRFNSETSRDAARRIEDTHDFAAWLKAWVSSDFPLEGASLCSDLLMHALDRVHWREIAEYYHAIIS